MMHFSNSLSRLIIAFNNTKLLNNTFQNKTRFLLNNHCVMLTFGPEVKLPGDPLDGVGTRQGVCTDHSVVA